MNDKPQSLPYGISFDTKKFEDQALIEFVSVSLKRDVMGLDDRVNVALRDDPLYPILERYVLDNPSICAVGGKS
jgi:hypothetical protein